MTAPDLPMRERIAEALFMPGNVPGSSTPLCLRHNRVRLDNGCRECLSDADAVLTVLADLPDTAVEAGAKAAREHQIVTGYGGNKPDAAADIVPYTFCPACYWEPQADSPVGIELQAENHRTRAAITATISAIKEGKA